MSERMPIHLTDDLIERMIRDRARGGAPADLTAAIVRRAADTQQRRRSWRGLPGLPVGSRQRLLFVAGLLALAIVGAGIVVVGSKILDDRSITPSPPVPSNALVETDAPPSVAPSQDVDPSASPDPSPSPAPAACATTPPTDAPRITTIDLPSKAYLRVSFAACSVWVTNNENGRGIHKVDLASNKVTRTVMKGPADHPVFAVRSDGDELWTVTWGDPVTLQRIDPTRGKPDRSFVWPMADLGGGIWILGENAWAGPRPRQNSDQTVTVIDLESGAVIATIEDLVPYQMWRDASAVWAIARPSSAAANAGDNDVDLVRIDPATLEVTRVRLPREATKDGINATVHSGALFFAGLGEIHQVSQETGEIGPRIPIAHADYGALLVWTGSELWALPIESTPLTNGFDNRSRELVQIDPTTGAILRRIPLRERGVMDLAYSYGSLWILAPDADYSQTFGMHLIRVELPSSG